MAFTSDVFVYDRETDTIERVSVACRRHARKRQFVLSQSISADGRYVAF